MPRTSSSNEVGKNTVAQFMNNGEVHKARCITFDTAVGSLWLHEKEKGYILLSVQKSTAMTEHVIMQLLGYLKSWCLFQIKFTFRRLGTFCMMLQFSWIKSQLSFLLHRNFRPILWMKKPPTYTHLVCFSALYKWFQLSK